MRPFAFLIAAVMPFAAFANQRVSPVIGCEAEVVSVPTIYDDPFSRSEMAEAKHIARMIQPALVDWENVDADPLNLNRTRVTLMRMRKLADVDGKPFSNLFLIVQRYLLSTKGNEGKVRPIADLLGLTPAEAKKLTNFFSQVDIFCVKKQMTPVWPKFMQLSARPADFLRWELNLEGNEYIPPEALSFFNKTLAPVLGERIHYARFKINKKGNQLTLYSPVGVYKINLYRRPVGRRTIAPLQVKSTEAWGRQNDFVIHGQVDVFTEDDEAKSFVRTLVRADAFFHPHLVPPAYEIYPQPAIPSEIQLSAVSRLMKLDNQIARDQEEFGPITLGIMQPTGEGKTIVLAEYIRKLITGKWEGQKPKIILVVENTQILQQTVTSLHRDLGLDPKKISMLFGTPGEVTLGAGAVQFTVPRGAAMSPATDFDLVVTTRSTYHARQSTFNFLIEKERKKVNGRPFMVVVDEAHHVGTDAGQFEEILDGLHKRLTPRDRILLMSATMWHPDMDIIGKVLKGAITGTHLLEDELRQLQAGQELETLARTQFLRAEIAGWVGPIDDESISLKNASNVEESMAERVRMTRMADAELYAYVIKKIMDMRGDVRDRYLFFEVRNERAEDGAIHLQNRLGTGKTVTDMTRSSWFMHSNLTNDEQTNRMAWFKDAGVYRGTRFQHKYLETVSQALEGVDIRNANGIVIMRNLSSNRLVQQVLGRGTRLEAFKTGVRLIDVPGKVVEYLEQAGSLWDRARMDRADLSNYGVEPEESLWDKPVQPKDKFPDEGKSLPKTSTIAADPIDVEPHFERERALINRWREVDADELETFVDQDGASELLTYDPKSGMRLTRINIQNWFAHWFQQFDPETQNAWRAHWIQLNLPSQDMEIDEISPAQFGEALKGFHLLGKIFNGLSANQRRGFEPLADTELAKLGGQSRVLALLDPRFNTYTYGNTSQDRRSMLTINKMSNSESKELSESLYDRLILEGPKPHGFIQAIQANQRRKPMDVLRMVEGFIKLRPALATEKALYIMRVAQFQTALEGDNGEIANSLASYYLAYLLNSYLDQGELTANKPWNINGFFGVSSSQLREEDYVMEPSEYDLWMTLDLIEHRLKNQ